MTRGTRGAYRKEDRVALPPELQKEIVEKAAAKYGNCQELAKHLEIPKSSVHYYRVGRLTMPQSILERMLDIAGDDGLRARAEDRGIAKDRTWANEYAVSVYREMCRERVRLPTREELERDDQLRRKAAAIISYVMAEGSVWLQKEKWGECAANITFAAHETDLYDHFRGLCRDVFDYDIGLPQKPGNNTQAIRGFIYSRFIAEWLIENGVFPGEKSARELHLPVWVRESSDRLTLVSALQPWCDGEGSTRATVHPNSTALSLAQSRHTNLKDTDVPRCYLGRDARTVSRGSLEKMEKAGIRILSRLQRNCRSEILDEVAAIASKLGFRPRVDVLRIRLKGDGRWSCIWTAEFDRQDAISMLSDRILTQSRKVARIRWPGK
ncbi:MAG: hypothetical protein JW880_02015 [Candidatus Thermoplasmatota archaeon]|nr:hypothetical protein [Candidatus Thermoplasmatota archaeon]